MVGCSIEEALIGHPGAICSANLLRSTISAAVVAHTVGCQRRTVLSLDPDAMRLCAFEKATEYTAACSTAQTAPQLGSQHWTGFSRRATACTQWLLGCCMHVTQHLHDAYLVSSKPKRTQLWFEVPDHHTTVQGTRDQLLQVGVKGY